MEIKSESLMKRCEICHQADLYNPETNRCMRCEFMSEPDAEDLIFDLEQEDGLVYKKKVELTPSDLVKLDFQYSWWRDANRSAYENCAIDFLTHALSVQRILVEQKSFYKKLLMIDNLRTRNSSIETRFNVLLAVGFIIFGFGFLSGSSMMFFLGLCVCFYLVFFLFFDYIEVRKFRKLDRMWWRTANGDTKAIIEKYKAE